MMSNELNHNHHPITNYLPQQCQVLITREMARTAEREFLAGAVAVHRRRRDDASVFPQNQRRTFGPDTTHSSSDLAQSS